MEAIPEASDPTRLALITRLALSTKKHDVDSTTYALVWLSDISQLEWMVDRSISSLYEIQEILSQYKGYQLRDCIKDWATAPCTWYKGKTETELFELGWQKPLGLPLTCPEPPTSRGLTRNSYVAVGPTGRKVPHLDGVPADVVLKRTMEYNCLDRDEEQCILTKCGEPLELVYIYAGSLGEGKNLNDNTEEEPAIGSAFEYYTTCWRWIYLFWNETKVSGWQQAVDRLTQYRQPCEGMITLSSNAHALWRMARFALKPIKVTEDEKKMTLRFFWLPVVHNPRLRLTDPPVYSSNLSGAPNRAKLWNYETNKEVCSGDIITVTTEDPKNNPLPSMALLELQWCLTRVLALSGAAEFPNTEVFDDISEEEKEPEVKQETPSDVVRDSIEDEMDSNDPNNQNWTPDDLPSLTTSSAEEERGRKRVRHS
ncbi:hypothetical protein N7499_012850 [Penicillium canescens]|nr:hypothetical protein N7522_002537 [Penicillium canescens]KAJ6064170.1 hypothetical protein N7499_012850 [Penicillium canescens]KAJ6154335.1 hypothetical protein N7485_012704 [Penicillium canescens]